MKQKQLLYISYSNIDIWQYYYKAFCEHATFYTDSYDMHKKTSVINSNRTLEIHGSDHFLGTVNYCLQKYR